MTPRAQATSYAQGVPAVTSLLVVATVAAAAVPASGGGATPAAAAAAAASFGGSGTAPGATAPTAPAAASAAAFLAAAVPMHSPAAFRRLIRSTLRQRRAMLMSAMLIRYWLLEQLLRNKKGGWECAGRQGRQGEGAAASSNMMRISCRVWRQDNNAQQASVLRV